MKPKTPRTKTKPPPPPVAVPPAADMIAEGARLGAAQVALRMQELEFAYRLYEEEGHRRVESFTEAVRAIAGPGAGHVDEWAKRVWRQLINAASFYWGPHVMESTQPVPGFDRFITMTHAGAPPEPAPAAPRSRP